MTASPRLRVQRSASRWALGAVVVAALAAAGCSGSGDAEVASAAAGGAPAAAATGAASGSGGTAAEVAAYLKGRRAWVECMNKHDMDLPDPDARGHVDKTLAKMDPKVQKAAKACKGVAPELTDSVAEALEPPLTAAQKAANKRYAECMREKGIGEFPDPTETGRIRFPNWKPSEMPPGFQDAQDKCGAEPGYREAFPEMVYDPSTVKG